MRIAICDDELDEIVRIRSFLLRMNGNYRIDTFQTGREMLEEIGRGADYGLLFCDIYLREENGVEVARAAQRLLPDANIVFTTTSRDHAVEAFSLRALHYIVKPVREEDIVEVFQRMGQRRETRRTLTLRIDRLINVLYQDEILKVEGQNHRTVITQTDGTVYAIWKPFREINDMLDSSFVPIKKGVAVNMRCITRMTAHECALTDNSKYLLRRDKSSEIRERYFSFLEADLRQT